MENRIKQQQFCLINKSSDTATKEKKMAYDKIFAVTTTDMKKICLR